LGHVAGNGKAWKGRIDPVESRATRAGNFGGPEHSQFARLELSVTAIANALPLG
jgi:hypothetical protein